jgi:hypothetical protein
MAELRNTRITYDFVTRAIARTLGTPGKGYFALLGTAVALLTVGVVCLLFLLRYGLGLAGYSHPVYWAVYITCFVFWVGIAHSGTLISAILFLFRSGWRTAVYRTAEAMTVFAVMTAGLFPLIHIGRQWYFYWLLPYPNERGLWPNFKSPLIWDEFAIGTYFTVSTVFLIMGLIPDIAAVRDVATGWRKRLYALTAVGWRGTNEQWRHYTRGYLYLAALATPLVLSVHSVVSWDFAMALVPGWHATIFAPYFVAGAIYSGVAMVITLLIPIRKLFPPGRADHRPALREPGEALPPDGHDRGLRLLRGVFHGLVRRPRGRAGRLLVSRVRAVLVGELDDDHLQRVPAAVVVAQERADQYHSPVRHLDLRERRDVVRALRDHRRVPGRRAV